MVGASHAVLDVLKSGESFTISKLASESNLNFRTVKKVLEILRSGQASLSGKQLEVSALDNVTIVQLKEKTGLALFPEAIQNLIIKTSHYPAASREEEILVYLFLKNAKAPEHAISIPGGKILDELVEAEHVGKVGNRFCLTEDGSYIAKGALELYPELEKIKTEKITTQAQINDRVIVRWQKFQPPNISMMKQRIKVKVQK